VLLPSGGGRYQLGLVSTSAEALSVQAQCTC